MPIDSAEKSIPVSDTVLLLVDFINPLDFDVPSDCTAAESKACKKQALDYMHRVMQCDVAPSAFVRMGKKE